jgi:hypothetical protein
MGECLRTTIFQPGLSWRECFILLRTDRRPNISPWKTQCAARIGECLAKCLHISFCRSFAAVETKNCSAECLLYTETSLNEDSFLKDETASYYHLVRNWKLDPCCSWNSSLRKGVALPNFRYPSLNPKCQSMNNSPVIGVNLIWNQNWINGTP